MAHSSRQPAFPLVPEGQHSRWGTCITYFTHGQIVIATCPGSGHAQGGFSLAAREAREYQRRALTRIACPERHPTRGGHGRGYRTSWATGLVRCLHPLTHSFHQDVPHRSGLFGHDVLSIALPAALSAAGESRAPLRWVAVLWLGELWLGELRVTVRDIARIATLIIQATWCVRLHEANALTTTRRLMQDLWVSLLRNAWWNAWRDRRGRLAVYCRLFFYSVKAWPAAPAVPPFACEAIYVLWAITIHRYARWSQPHGR